MLVVLFCLGLAVVGSSATDTVATDTVAIDTLDKSAQSAEDPISLFTSPSPPSLENTEALSGTVRFIRKMDKMEIFFTEHKNQFILPHTIHQPEIMAKLTDSMKNKKSITFHVRNGSIVFVGNAPSQQNNGSSSQNTNSGVGAPMSPPTSSQK